MPNLKELRNRIRSVQSTQKITQAMKMVAASKLRRAQERAEATRPYAERMERLLASLAAGAAGEYAPRLLQDSGKEDVHLVVVATADRGLCGPFNTTIVRAARAHIRELAAAGRVVKILCVGRKGRDMLRRDHGDKIVDTVEFAGVRQLTFDIAAPIAARIIEMFEAEEFDVCTIFYNRFVSVISQQLTRRQLVPVALPEPSGEAEGTGTYYEYEPDEAEILAALLPRNLSVQVYRALLENAASEQGARMTAMDNATRNAGDMIDRLTLYYNRTRQANITRELIEIISGAEAL